MIKMIKIVHAVGDYDKIDGDSSGKEIIETKWYNRTGGWTYLLVCKDETMAKRAAAYAKLIAANDNYGYSKEQGANGRWSGYKSIIAHKALGKTVEESIMSGKGNFDCSSLCIACYILAGLNHKASGYTGDMVKTFKSTSKFDVYTSGNYVGSDSYAEVGSLYLAPKAHVAMAIDNASNDQPMNTVMALGSVRIRKEPKTGKTVDILHKGEYMAITGVDEETGWYKVTYKGETCYVTNNERYVKATC